METIERRIEMIRADREHGSRWLVGQAIALLYDLANETQGSTGEKMERLRAAARAIAAARPAMAAPASAAARIMKAAGEGPSAVADEARIVREQYEHAVEDISSAARPLLTGTLLTHSLSGTVSDVLTACASQIERVVVLEGRPRYEGCDTARMLARNDIPVTLITDAQADIFLPRCRAVVVGADTVLADGAIINKAGTSLLAWAARGRHIPFYVLCETLKISPRTWMGNLAALEEKEPEEVLEEPIAGVTVRNFYFDCTPARLVTGVITEEGILRREDIKRRAVELNVLMHSLTSS